jgi:hypothetical protein
MSRRKPRRRKERQRLAHAGSPSADPTVKSVVQAHELRRLTYTRTQAAGVLGVSLRTLDRRVIPAIETVKTEWGARLVPAAELERFLAERIERARQPHPQRGRAGRPHAVSDAVADRIRREHGQGRSFGEIARALNDEGVPTAQGGRQWWPSTVKAIVGRAI